MSRTQVILNFIAFFINIFILAVGQVPPGVNPNHYQQYQPVEQHQYQQQQYQQPPPPPQQQYHQPPPPQQQYQQPPQQQGHGHGHHHEPQLLNTVNIGQERDHIKEHLDVPIDTSKMTEKELHYHYFTMHDADKNNKLDGCELIKSLIHWHDDDDKADYVPKSDEYLAQKIDPILQNLDKNHDGYIDFVEFKMSSH